MSQFQFPHSHVQKSIVSAPIQVQIH